MLSQTSATNPADLGAVEARSLIARRALSPLELADACIARVEAIDHAVNALVARDFDGLREGAKAMEDRLMSGLPLGALHGLPFAVKDMIDVKGLHTTFGSEIFRNNIASKDDAVVAAMRAAGAMPIGKTNVPEWSLGANTRNRVYGVTANPHDLTRSCAGSSGGSAVALACRYAPLATGSDTGGSVRNPAAFCGIVGYRPSSGLVPGDTRAVALIPWSTIGPMARNVADCALMLSVLARPDHNDPFTTVIDGRTLWDPAHFANLPRRDLSSVKIAATEDFGIAPTAAIVRRHFRSILPRLQPYFGALEEAAPDCSDADRIFSVLRGVLCLRMAELVDNQPDLVGPNVTDNVAEGRSYSGEDVSKALIAQGRYQRDWQAFFEDHDYLISPAITISPPPWRELFPVEIDGEATKSYYHWLGMAYTSTIPGHPSITIPCGRDEKGLPFGLQIVGRRHGDLGLLAIAAELEQVINGHSDLAPCRPDIDMLKSAPHLSEAEGFLGFE
ncbi:amidase [Mesorhizobium waimense]|uniref:Amidase n=1 Tax=Mesorhizobium waimense TaxID=1300307 RepID=A0A3A5JYI9_9HYPH|nr:amidase [Mesorhizobium waimense]RJT27225.1 amidase [Mesorhizobium waimense]